MARVKNAMQVASVSVMRPKAIRIAMANASRFWAMMPRTVVIAARW
jgi:hypothetical protein